MRRGVHDSNRLRCIDYQSRTIDYRQVCDEMTSRLQADALFEESLVRVPGGLSANRK
jgi:hypothetical protein